MFINYDERPYCSLVTCGTKQSNKETNELTLDDEFHRVFSTPFFFFFGSAGFLP